jgi:uncharacterized membrane protein YccC
VYLALAHNSVWCLLFACCVFYFYFYFSCASRFSPQISTLGQCCIISFLGVLARQACSTAFEEFAARNAARFLFADAYIDRKPAAPSCSNHKTKGIGRSKAIKMRRVNALGGVQSWSAARSGFAISRGAASASFLQWPHPNNSMLSSGMITLTDTPSLHRHLIDHHLQMHSGWA